MTPAIGVSERRRLSTIFQRLMRAESVAAPRSRNGSSCQSPRVQRCTRDAATSAWNGASSISVDVGHRGAARPARLRAGRGSAPGSRAGGRCSTACIGVDVEQALAGEGALAEHVLVDLGPANAVRVEPRCPRTASDRTSLVAGRAAAWRRAAAGCRSRAPRGRSSGRSRPVERMRGDADQVAQPPGRQPRVAVERQHVDAAVRAAAYRGRGDRSGPVGRASSSSAPSLPRLRSQPIQLLCGREARRRAVQQQEACYAVNRMALVQPRDLLARVSRAPRRRRCD